MRRPLLLLPALLLGCGTDVSSPAGHAVSCLLGDPLRPELGQVVQVRGEANQEVCLSTNGDTGAWFAYIPFLAVPPVAEEPSDRTVALSLVGGAFDPPASAGTIDPGGPVLLRGGTADGGEVAGYPRDAAFHAWLRQREIRELTPLLRRGSGPAPGPEPGARPGRDAAGEVLPAAVPAEGDLVELNVAISCSATDIRTGVVSHVSERAIIVQDMANPEVIESADIAYFGETFDTLVHPVETAHFGAPTDIDGNGRSILFFTRAVNQRNTGSGDFLTIGFFWSGDLFPEAETETLQACPAANQAEMFYLIAPDPQGQVGPQVTLSELERWAIPLIGHEYQHLINAARRMYVNEASEFEATWLNEGLSHAAEELLFFRAAGLEPLMNLGIEDVRDATNGVEAFNIYMAGNFTNYSRYLSRPDTASLMGPDALTTRGAAWAFLRYAADRAERGDEAFFFDVVNSRESGLENLAGVLGGPDEPLQWMHDWTVSVYADDFAPGLDERYRLGSWNLRDLYEGSTLEIYPLATTGLSLDGPRTLELSPGGTAYTELGVLPDDRAMVHVEAEGGIPPLGLRGSVVRVR